MASKKDMRRLDLAIPYVDPPANKDDADMSGAMTSTLPMAAMFTRNRMIGWVSFVFSLQNWLGETPDQKRTASTPGYMSVFMSLMALVVVRLKFPDYLPCLVIGSGTYSYGSFFFLTCLLLNNTFPVTLQLSYERSRSLQGPFREKAEFMSIENLKTFDPFAEADEDTGETKQSQNYIHIRIQQRNGRKTLTTVQGLPKKFDQKKILKVIKKKFACNGTIVADSEMGEVIQLQGDQRKDVQEFLTDKKEGLELDAKTIKVHGF
ncbi:hypothetical protein ANOM_003668 [Aspergillus nomiae NRRL 13137]|uniref:SUI1 domain-containing protein n=1 Tax=Aspergillus nomiae NRRL (strain ATCC 15546 / NRRL 13137 / CBS 260.88 / M93) TaxID=1509407 RepID=A0A0L1J219_ASPN3|nr:uncharacterized protein ANOM_003668 [Aspergillus nomiae NRRL 13137]KNG85861.1 hypothetical protein ANOM_003668 [Aspergillus nomiae NRRL 13137]